MEFTKYSTLYNELNTDEKYFNTNFCYSHVVYCFANRCLKELGPLSCVLGAQPKGVNWQSPKNKMLIYSRSLQYVDLKQN
jgi:hypothetical protein